jgi:hypothetical protein
LLDAGHFALDERTDENRQPHSAIHGQATKLACIPPGIAFSRKRNPACSVPPL